MGTEQITKRILSDAEAEALAIVADAEKKAEKLLSDASLRAEETRKTIEAEVAEKRRAILEKRAADARLDCAKALLGEKRKVVETVYDEAHSRLLELPKEDAVALVERLLCAYAEAGDEIVFDKYFPYAAEVKILPVVKEKDLRIAKESQEIGGGLRLIGKVSDKDLSFKALILADRDENQASLARELFK
jgi:vacuolar-type H+-ATPase subunit E/Vma4